MNPIDDSVHTAIDVKAEDAIPFHYGMYEGKDEDEFKEKLKNKIEVVILKR